MDNEVLVKVEGVSKKFCRNLKRSLWYGVKDISSELFGLSSNGQLRKEEFWAVNDVSFELRRGECLGLIGHNGAGKSTLLKMLNGLIKPDKGSITMRGRIGALIELGSGFNPILTGRENIYSNGAVLGFSKKEIDKKFNDIVDFAEVGDFIDTPVQNYSSGMKVRLGFAVAAQMEPDVLIIDEVLAVGDVGFRTKCYNMLSQLQKEAAIILVAHQMSQIGRLSDKILLLSRGNSFYQGSDVNTGIQHYYDMFGRGKSKLIFGDGKVSISDVGILSEVCLSKEDIPSINYLSSFELSFILFSKVKIEKLELAISYFDKSNNAVASSISDRFSINNNERKKIVIRNEQNLFAKGVYSIHLVIFSFDQNKRMVMAKYQDLISFKSVGFDFMLGNIPINLAPDWKIDFIN